MLEVTSGSACSPCARGSSPVRPSWSRATRRARPRTTSLRAFYRWWLALDDVDTATKDATLFPTYTPDLAGDIAKEPEAFGVYVTLGMKGTFATLLTAPFSFLDARLADADVGRLPRAGDVVTLVNPAHQRVRNATQARRVKLG